MHWSVYLILTLAGIAFVLLALLWNRHVIYTHLTNKFQGTIIAVYYLPESIIKVAVKSKIAMEFDRNGDFLDASLVQQDYEVSVVNAPDTTQSYCLAYNLNPFSSDKIKIALDESGLLQTADFEMDSKAPEIISALADAPAEILETQRFRALKKPALKTEDNILEFIDYEKEFKIPASETIGRTKNIDWEILLESKTQDLNKIETKQVGFTIEARAFGTPQQFTAGFSIEADKKFKAPGLLFRSKSQYNIHFNNNDVGESVLEDVDLINKKQIFSVPIKTTPFVKREQKIQIHKGTFYGHELVNPSALEGFISIPINLTKAIVSIPAQLLRFRIDNLGVKRDLETAKRELKQEQQQRLEQEVSLREALKTATESGQVDKAELQKIKAELFEAQMDGNMEIERLRTKRRQLEEKIRILEEKLKNSP